jgi:hypothetical protein
MDYCLVHFVQTTKYFASWLGICPGSKISGSRVLSSKKRQVVNRASNAFRIAAQSLANSKNALGGFYRRIRTRSGAPVAITATARWHGSFTICGLLVKTLSILVPMLMSNSINNECSNISNNVPNRWVSS